MAGTVKNEVVPSVQGEESCPIEPGIIPCPNCGTKALTVNGAVASVVRRK
jgi:hypothetical protein